MKTVRILAIVPLALISLMNLGYAFGTDPKPDLPVAIAVFVLGLAGLAGAYGLGRNTAWGVPAALGVAAVNVAAAVIALVNDSEGAAIGLVISGLALVLTFAAGSATRKASVA